MKSKLHTEVPVSKSLGRGSIHQLKGIPWLRVLAFSFVVVGLDFGRIKSDQTFPQKTKYWLSDFLETNILTSPIISEKMLANRPKIKEGELLAGRYNKSQQVLLNLGRFAQLQPRIHSSVSSTNSTNNSGGALFLRSNKYAHLSQMDDSLLISERIFEFDGLQKVEFTENNGLFDYHSSSLLNEMPVVKKWHVSLGFGPQLVNGDVTQPSADKYEQVSGINNIVSESGGVSYSSSETSFATQLGLGYDVTKHWRVSIALQYTQFNGSQIAYYDSEVTRTQTILTTVAVSDENGIKGFETEEETIEYTNHFSDTLTAKYRLSNIEIPLAIQYKKEWGKFYGFLSTGISGVLKSNYSASYDSKEIGSGVITQESWKFSAMNMNIGIGLGIKLQPDLSVQLYPQYSKLFPIQESTSIQHATRSFGVFGGFVYSFK